MAYMYLRLDNPNMIQHDKINDRIKERRNIEDSSREGAGLKEKM